MSIYVLEDYIKTSKKQGNNISWKGLVEHKRKYWRE